MLLVVPPSPEATRAPLLSLAYLASSLRSAGHEVAVLDAAAPHGPADLAAEAARLSPTLIGVHVKTPQARAAYAVARSLGGLAPLVAGGPHATACPSEALDEGFDYAVRGEGEAALVELADMVDRQTGDPGTILGLSWRGPTGVLHAPPRPFADDLDALPSPLAAADLFPAAWYGPGAIAPASGILASRGCPSACTFCANQATGRRFRARSVDGVVAEAVALRERHGHSSMVFLDDSFAVGRRRTIALCEGLRRCGPWSWTCTAHPAHLDRPVLAAMRDAGCAGIDLGVETGSPAMLARIGKGVTHDRVLEVLGWCRDLGLRTVVNLMVGWPDESDADLDASFAFLERAAPLADAFNALGALVPYPGTPLYEEHHAAHGFTSWWLRDPPLRPPVFPATWAPDGLRRAMADDPALARNFFHHPPDRLARMRRLLERKAELTVAAMLQRSKDG